MWYSTSSRTVIGTLSSLAKLFADMEQNQNQLISDIYNCWHH